MTPEEQFDRVFASAMQDRQALLRFLDGVTEVQARWHPPDGEWSILEEAAIRDLMGQGMLEGKFALGEELRLIEKLGGLHVGQAVVESLFGQVGNGLQEWQGHLGANHGSGLQEVLLLGR